jgi:hypothetical protein
MVEVRLPDKPRRVYKVAGRVGRIIYWLVNHEARVSVPSHLQVTFNCGDGEVKVDIRETERIDAAVDP